MEHLVDCANGVCVWHVQGVVDESRLHLGLEVLCDPPLANALCDGPGTCALELLLLDVLVEDRPRRVGEPALDAPLTLVLEEACGSSERTAGSSSGDESVELPAVGLRPDLWTGRVDVRLPVGDIVELVGPDGVFEGFGVPAGLVVVILRVIKGDSWRGERREGVEISARGSSSADASASSPPLPLHYSPGTGYTSAPSILSRSIFSWDCVLGM